ncbi:hypothetical protein D3C79_685220 [compost metagenome]
MSVPVKVFAYSARRLLPRTDWPGVRLEEWVRSTETAPMAVLRPAPSASAWKLSLAWTPTMPLRLLLMP